eukprot:s3366_g6.t1
MQVKRKTDGMEGTIKQMTPNQVLLVVGGVEKSASAESFLKHEWKEVAIKADPVKIENWSERSPETNPHFFVQVLTGQIYKEMFARAKGQASLPLDVYSKPKNVIVTKDYKTGQLKIPISTMRVDIRGDDKVPQHSICVGKSLDKDWYAAIISPICF